MASKIGAKMRRLGSTLSEFGSAFEAGQTQDLRIEVPSSGGVHLTGTDPKPTRSVGVGLGGNPLLLLAGVAAVLFFAART